MINMVLWQSMLNRSPMHLEVLAKKGPQNYARRLTFLFALLCFCFVQNMGASPVPLANRLPPGLKITLDLPAEPAEVRSCLQIALFLACLPE